MYQNISASAGSDALEKKFPRNNCDGNDYGNKAGLHLDANQLEAHYLAKGNVPNVVNALISADKANISLDFNMAAAIDLAGRDVLKPCKCL